MLHVLEKVSFIMGRFVLGGKYISEPFPFGQVSLMKF